MCDYNVCGYCRNWIPLPLEDGQCMIDDHKCKFDTPQCEGLERRKECLSEIWNMFIYELGKTLKIDKILDRLLSILTALNKLFR